MRAEQPEQSSAAPANEAAPPVDERRWEYRPDVFGGVEDISDTLVVREHGVFLLTDPAGNVPPGNRRGLGLYAGDTRHLSVYDFTLDAAQPVLLLSTADSGFSEEQVLGNHKTTNEAGATIGRCTVELRRHRVLNSGLDETLTITNYNAFSVSVRPAYYFDADFLDIFEIRGHQRSHSGNLERPRVEGNGVVFQYSGADGLARSTRIEFDREPDLLTPYRADFVLHLAPRQTVEMRIHIALDSKGRAPAAETRRTEAEYAHWRSGFTRIHTDNEAYDKLIARSISDLRMLWSEDPQGRHYLAAGTPWFDALFGRDSLITSLQTLPYQPEIARDCLLLLARHRGQIEDAFNCEEPGKILHELRYDELSAIGELPYQRYYGSVDSTPLFLILAAEYYAWTGDKETLQELRPALLAAIGWIQKNASLSPSRYLTYLTDSPAGLRNQGWKDSDDGVVHRDGTLTEGPTALAEVQGYLYSAYRRLAPVMEALGDADVAADLRRRSLHLRRSFNRDFCLPDHDLVPMALGRGGRPGEPRSSNAGQVLWSRILSSQRAAAIRDMLFENDMFSGWGVRTLSADSPAFNPVGYHMGTIWPHDNALIALGLKYYGFRDEVNEIATGLFDAAREFPYSRLPELFGGQPRSQHQPPVPYPVACRPQAWTAGSMLQILRAILGLAADATRNRLYIVRPKLPYWLKRVDLTGLRVGKSEVALSFIRETNRTRIDLHSAGDVQVTSVSQWPEI